MPGPLVAEALFFYFLKKGVLSIVYFYSLQEAGGEPL